LPWRQAARSSRLLQNREQASGLEGSFRILGKHHAVDIHAADAALAEDEKCLFKDRDNSQGRGQECQSVGNLLERLVFKEKGGQCAVIPEAVALPAYMQEILVTGLMIYRHTERIPTGRSHRSGMLWMERWSGLV
jgi:hypothetical protein